jgi:glycosyltransferase involved in cell wall biosynthesis
MKILFTTPVLEHPAAGGPQLRIENSIIALSRVSDLHVLSRVDKHSLGGETSDSFFRSHCKEFVYVPSIVELSGNRYIRKIQKIGRKFLRGISFFKKDSDFIIDYAEKENIDVLWFGYGNISFPLIKEIKRKRSLFKIVCDTDSVWSRFILRELPYENDFFRRKKIEKDGTSKEQEEREWINLCDVTTAVSEVDADYYRSIATVKQKIHIFSNVIDVGSYKVAPHPPIGFKSPSFYLAGTFGHYHSPMDTAARWIIQDVLLLVRKVIPNVHFYIVGRGSDVLFGNLNDPGITVTGKLDSVLPYLCNTDVAIVPLKFESGTRFKILEAGACKVPIVSTTLGAEGIPVIDGVHILIADEPHDFAQAIIKLLSDRNLANQLAQNCHQIVNEHFSVESLAGEAGKILDYLTYHSHR